MKTASPRAYNPQSAQPLTNPNNGKPGNEKCNIMVLVGDKYVNVINILF